ncbi:MAG: glycosyltransferase, partial [Firmicutes bacterium]|nr:glycosyltransferase [Bacillota bacterium]
MRNVTPFLSVVIPAYNEEHRLPATLGSIPAPGEFFPLQRQVQFPQQRRQ